MHRGYHENRSIEIFGSPFTEVHIFLDQFFLKYGDYHRRILHHSEGIELVVKKFGESARKPAEQHILDDIGCVRESWMDYQQELTQDLQSMQEDDLKNLYFEQYEQVRFKYFVHKF
ncbi:MAG: hypothetical protein HQK78_19785 [Desulfobacterales bacterium]|nr:hypothetical protein [Desulfobacterales bacterium]